MGWHRQSVPRVGPISSIREHATAVPAGLPVPEAESVPDDDLVGEPDRVAATDVPVATESDLETDVSAGLDSESEFVGTSGDLSKFGLEVPLRHRLTEEQWQYATWGAVAAGAVAIVALLAVVFGLLSGSKDAAPLTCRGGRRAVLDNDA